MKNDAFEEKLRAQPMRQIPPGWRNELISKARQAETSAPATGSMGWSLARLRESIDELLWPAPQAWAALLAIWVGLLALHLAGRSRVSTAALGQAPATPAVVAALKEQRRVLAEVSEAIRHPSLKSSASGPPGPRSQMSNPYCRI